ncbi:DUF4169 family protein [Maricaulis sp.]|jgi:Domain of unknown function (DUF4169)|uniref:DUF4169 family protein n=1 Tax=Maricaulis sp. TaxID=1486257 RepID=UPI0026038D09|nr:DUF4169 family protein [Maricaulis sp.]MDF1768274.1 DUF4169 family protein [Maricaulis sp.]
MTKPVNLRQYRKQKARRDKAETAATNRVVHGTPKALRDAADAEAVRRQAELDGKKRD